MILCLSGGLDSSSLLFEYKDKIKLCVSFKYGSNHNDKELECAKTVAQKANIEHMIVDVSDIFKHFKSALLSGSDSVPSGVYDKQTVGQLVVPFRNGIFLSILAGLAESRGCKYIALASHSNDAAIYPDCTVDFSQSMGDAITKGTTNNVEFFKPYITLTKKDIALRGIKHGLDPDWTYSCYKGGDKPCGVCPTCVERNEAIAYALKQV